MYVCFPGGKTPKDVGIDEVQVCNRPARDADTNPPRQHSMGSDNATRRREY